MFSPYAAMGNSPGMMIDPNGETTKYAEDLTAAENDWLMNSPGRLAWNLGRNTDRNGASRMLGHNMGGDMMMLMYAGGGGSFRIDRDGSMSGTGAGARIMFELYLKYSNDLSQRYVPSNDDLTDLEFSDDILPGLQVSARSGKWMPANLDEVASAIQRHLLGIVGVASGENFIGKLNDILSPAGVPLWGIEYQLGKALAASDANDYIKPFNEKRMLEAYPQLRNRPVNIHIPRTGLRMEIPRNYVKRAGNVLQGVGILSAGISFANDLNKYRSGQMTTTHLVVNTIMNGVGFIGPWGAAASIVYGILEDYIW